MGAPQLVVAVPAGAYLYRTAYPNPDDRIQDIARRMAEADIGFMPVGDKERLVGTITDRDIVVRGLAKGCDPTTTTVGDIFSAERNPDRKKPFDIRRVMAAAIDQDHAPLERWREESDRKRKLLKRRLSSVA